MSSEGGTVDGFGTVRGRQVDEAAVLFFLSIAVVVVASASSHSGELATHSGGRWRAAKRRCHPVKPFAPLCMILYT
jgi:hypothetical protein